LIIRIPVSSTAVSSRDFCRVAVLLRRSYVAISFVTYPATPIVNGSGVIIEVVIVSRCILVLVTSVRTTSVLYGSAVLSTVSSHHDHIILTAVVIVVWIVIAYIGIIESATHRPVTTSVAPGIPGIVEAIVTPGIVCHATTPEGIVEATVRAITTAPAPGGIHTPVRITPAGTDADGDARTNAPVGSRAEGCVVRAPERIVIPVSKGCVEAGIIPIAEARSITCL
jgi:hypothetical protein